MSSHLEIWKPSGRELITLSGQRVIVGQASTNPCRSSTTRPSRAYMPYWKTWGLLGRYAMWVVAMAPTSTEKRSLPNESCVLETSCESAIHG